MKHIALFAFTVVLFSACAGLPPVDSPQSSLVVGSISLDFPGSYFTWGARKITDTVELNLRDDTTGKEFWIYSSNGYYWFTANGTDEYTLESCQFSETIGSTAYVLGERKIGIKIPASPGVVLYAGDIAFSYAYVADSATGIRRRSTRA